MSKGLAWFFAVFAPSRVFMQPWGKIDNNFRFDRREVMLMISPCVFIGVSSVWFHIQFHDERRKIKVCGNTNALCCSKSSWTTERLSTKEGVMPDGCELPTLSASVSDSRHLIYFNRPCLDWVFAVSSRRRQPPGVFRWFIDSTVKPNIRFDKAIRNQGVLAYIKNVVE